MACPRCVPGLAPQVTHYELQAGRLAESICAQQSPSRSVYGHEGLVGLAARTLRPEAGWCRHRVRIKRRLGLNSGCSVTGSWVSESRNRTRQEVRSAWGEREPSADSLGRSRSAGRLAQGDGGPGDGGQLHGQLTAVNASGFVWRKGDPVLVLERVGRVNVVIVQGVRFQNRNVTQSIRVDGECGHCMLAPVHHEDRGPTRLRVVRGYRVDCGYLAVQVCLVSVGFELNQE